MITSKNTDNNNNNNNNIVMSCLAKGALRFFEIYRNAYTAVRQPRLPKTENSNSILCALGIYVYNI